MLVCKKEEPEKPHPLNHSLSLNGVVLFKLSNLINATSQYIFFEMRACLWQSPEHIQRVVTLINQPRTCGGSKKAVKLLTQASPFEQMIALENWFIYRVEPQKVHTRCLNLSFFEGGSIQLRVRAEACDLMSVILGTSRGKEKAPKYGDEMDTYDPWQKPESKKFIYPLEALEMVRQPDYIGATLIKGNAFESEYIDQDWRYGIKDASNRPRREACVELSKQKKLSNEKQKIKEQSAAYNLFQLLKAGLNKDSNLCDHIRNPNDDNPIHVSPIKLHASLMKACQISDTTDLYYDMFKLMVAKIGPQSTPFLNCFISARLFEGILNNNSCADLPTEKL